MSTLRYWTDLVRTHRRPSVCKEKRQPHNSSAGFLYWRTLLWFCIVFQLFNPGLLRLHRAVHDVACGGSALRRLGLRGDDGLLPDHGRLRRLLHHDARPDRLRHLRTRRRRVSHLKKHYHIKILLQVSHSSSSNIHFMSSISGNDNYQASHRLSSRPLLSSSHNWTSRRGILLWPGLFAKSAFENQPNQIHTIQRAF